MQTLNRINSGLKILLTVAIASFFIVLAPAASAAVGDDCTVADDQGNISYSDARCNISAGELCDRNTGTCQIVTLEQGGTGLSIPTGEVQLSEDIVQTRSFGGLLTVIVNYFIGFLGFVAVIVFVYAGVLWVVSGGNDEQITKAKKIMTYAALGLIVVLLSYSIVTFITRSAGGETAGGQCTTNSDCAEGQFCSSGGVCTGANTVACETADDCPSGQYICDNGFCRSNVVTDTCISSVDCGQGQYCGINGQCQASSDQTCSDNSACEPPKQCDAFGFCRNPNAGSNSTCDDNTDCPTGYVCNEDVNRCEVQGTNFGGGAVTGGGTQAASEEALNAISQSINALTDDLEDIEDDITSLPGDKGDTVLDLLDSGTLQDKIASINELLEDETDPGVIAVLERLLRGLERLKLVRDQLDELRAVMPETERTILLYDETSEALDTLIDEPHSSLNLRRFENKFNELKEMIRKFPVVQSKITAAPGEGSVPFTVTFDGLDSVDPTGGTISEYKWSFLDSQGNLVSLGNSPVVVHEFTEPNTYSVRLQVSTSSRDDSGYKLAIDGISTVRIKANPPSSNVDFRVNGNNVTDVYHVTMDEALAGLSFDPTPTVPALGRSITEYEWIYGDTTSEKRTVPATVVHSYDKAGEYFVTLKVTDSVGNTDKRVVKIVVKSLAADIEVEPSEGNVNTEFRFRGIESRSDDGFIRDYQWEISDTQGNLITTSQQESFTHAFDRPGQYNVSLLVTDTTGASDKRVEMLTVSSRKPVASFSYEKPEPNHPNRVEFNAINSYDPDQGDRITYSWDFDGDGNFEVVDSEESNVTHEYRKAGDYKVVLQVEDAFNQRDQKEQNVSIDSILSADIALESRAVQVGEEVTFSAVNSNAVAYLWEFGDGMTASTEEDSVTHTYNEKGKYTVRMNFFDRDDNDNEATATILAGEGDQPIAVATALIGGRNQVITEDLCGTGKDGYIVTRSDTISLSGRESVNRDGSSRLLVYNWLFSNGTRADQRDFTHRFDELDDIGECSSVELTVRDEISGTLSDEDIIYFKVVNELPEITDFVVEAEEGRNLVTPTKVKLRAVAPRDSDGQIKKYRWWYFREGFESERLGIHSTTSPQTEMIITAQGQPGVENKFFFVLEITDNDNGVFNTFDRFGETSFLVIENGPNLSPVAEFTMDKSTVATGDTITFISQSYDPQGDDLARDAFQWDFDGDGAFDDTTSGPQVSRQFNTPGEYQVRLRVTHRGLSSSATETVFVEPTNSYPQAAFTYRVDGTTVEFDASNSRFDPDLEDTTLRFRWDFDIQDDSDGNGINDDDVDSTEFDPVYTYPAPNLYRVKLTVLNSLGMEGVVVRDVNLGLSAAERERNTYRSLDITAPNQPMTSLLLSVSPYQISRGETSDVTARILNADGSPYSGQVFFEVLEGSGEFTPNPVKARESQAESIFTALDRGPVRIRVTATETYYGDIAEEVIINVK
jgi:PKD repeat protein